MAYTTFQKEFWSDDYILKLNSTQKTVYLYLVTNEKTTQCGIYELPIIKATTELGMCAEEFILYLKKFNDDKKICYSMETQEICVINWLKHNENNSWKTMERVKKELLKVKNPNLVVLLYDPREPLFSGVRKKKVEGSYLEEAYVIENPWKEMFVALTNEMLTAIRKPYAKHAPLMPLLCPLDTPPMGHLAYTYTNTESNSNSYTKTNAETVNHEEHVEPEIKKTIPYSPSSKNNSPANEYLNQQASLSDRINEGIKHWNSKDNLPHCSYVVATIPYDKRDEVNNKFNVFRDGQILNAIDNLSKAYDSIDQTYRPKNFQNFIVTSLDNWFEERSTEPVKRNYRTAEERRYFDHALQMSTATPEWIEEMKIKCIDSLIAIGEEFIDYEN